MAALLSFCLFALASHTIAAPPRLFNAGYLGSGLNLLTADVNVFDPAQFGAPVYNLTWAQGLTTEDGRWSIPDNSYARGYPACEFDASTTRITNTFDYQNWFSTSVSAHSSFFDLFSGSASTSYSQYNDFTYGSQKFVYMAHALCSTYQLAYTPFSKQNFSSDFIAGVAMLPLQFTAESSPQYTKFINYFGTHVINSLTMGGRMIINIFVNAEDYLTMSTHEIDVSAEAGISFIVDAGVDAHGEDKTTTHQTFAKYSQQDSLKCLGGDPGNCTFAAWAPSVPTNPAPVGYDLDDLASLLTADNFPNDPNIAQKQTALRSATRMFVQTNGTLPSLYCADASNTGGLPTHVASINHGIGSIPTYVQVQNTLTVDRIYSVFTPLEWAYDPSLTQNFITLSVDEQNVAITSFSGNNLAGTYDATTGQWKSSTNGYWTAAVLTSPPDFGGSWIPVSEGRQAVVLAQGLNASQITLVQVQFAETSQPTTVYPLVWRWSPQSMANPFSLTIENGEFAMQMIDGQSVHGMYTTDNKWVQYSTGFFRVNIFKMIADYNSGWIVSPPVNTAALLSVRHGLNVVPEIVQVFFSPDNGTSVYPVVWNYDSTNTPNPVSITADRHVISLSLIAATSLFRTWHAEVSDWTSFTQGSWKFTAFVSAVILV